MPQTARPPGSLPESVCQARNAFDHLGVPRRRDLFLADGTLLLLLERRSCPLHQTSLRLTLTPCHSSSSKDQTVCSGLLPEEVTPTTALHELGVLGRRNVVRAAIAVKLLGLP